MLDHFFLRYVSYFGLNHLCRYEVYFFILIKFWSCAFYSFGDRQSTQSLHEILSLNTNNHEKCQYWYLIYIPWKMPIFSIKKCHYFYQFCNKIVVTINYSRYLYGGKTSHHNSSRYIIQNTVIKKYSLQSQI
jgi:hypothetical protein